LQGLRRHVSDADEDVIALKLLQELDVAGYIDVVKKPGNAGFQWRRPGSVAAALIGGAETP
jgi:hypothetical protein